MDLYAIQKSYLDVQSNYGGGSTSATSDANLRDREEMARLSKLLNSVLFKAGQMIDSPNMRSYDVGYEAESDEQLLPPRRINSADFLSPFTRTANTNVPHHSGDRVMLADQFTWGAVVCAGVFIVVFVCVMAAWFVHKKQQDRVRRRIASAEARRVGAPYCIEGDMNGSGQQLEAPRPPSYFEVIGFFDPPPSYNDVLRVGSTGGGFNQASQAYDNAAVTIDELPPPFVESDYVKEDKVVVAIGAESATSAISSVSLTVIPVREDGSNA